MRGCSRLLDALRPRAGVVPAHAGMFPMRYKIAGVYDSGPRACGDVPEIAFALVVIEGWSPRMRGCSRGIRLRLRAPHVVPAHAGMFPSTTATAVGNLRGPRACGDVPMAIIYPFPPFGWSPRMRGCSPVKERGKSVHDVVPAHAGMFPSSLSNRTSRFRGPRACGDVPQAAQGLQVQILWSPRMRGCSRNRHEP